MNEEIYRQIGRNIAAIRKERGWTQTKLAHDMGIYPGQISNHEKKGHILFDMLFRYAEALGCKPADLLDETLDPERFHLDTDILGYWPYNLAAMVMYGCKYGRDGVRIWPDEARDGVYKVYIPFLLQSLNELTDREQQVLYMRYNNNMSLEETARRFKVTRERIRQVEAKALRKLKHPRHLKHWLMDTMDKAHDIAAERDRLRLENITLREKLDGIMKAMGVEEKDIKPEEPPKPDTRSIPIDELDLSVRSYNCLKRARYNYVSDLEKATMEDLMRVRNLGRRSLEEIVAKCLEHGIEIKYAEDCP